jgi:hypothetical protein
VKELISKLTPFLIFMLPAIIVGVLLGAYPGYQFYDYVWQDANFCFSCHVHDYATYAWKDSAHGKRTTCHDCHHQPLREYIREGIVFVLKQPKFPDDLHHTPNVPKDLCETCHVSTHLDRSTLTGPLAKEDLGDLPKVDQMYLHSIHLKAKTKFTLLKSHQLSKKERWGEEFELPKAEEGKERMIACSDCHGGPFNRAHNFGAVDKSCLRCHDKVHKSPMGEKFGCRNCHFPAFTLPADFSLESLAKPKRPLDFEN